MGVDVSHLVLVTLGHADNQVVDERPDCSQSRNIFPCAVVEFDVDNIFGGVREETARWPRSLVSLPIVAFVSYADLAAVTLQ